ncbi:FAD-dependent oxidoreductase [Streptomyces sp. NPDC002586]
MPPVAGVRGGQAPGAAVGPAVLLEDADRCARVARRGGDVRFILDGLVIASGVEARHLPGAPLHSERVWMLRTPADARTIDAALAGARHVAVIGGGFIGCEIGRTARTRALDVTITDVSPTLLHRSLGPALGAVARGPAPRPRRPSPPPPRRRRGWLAGWLAGRRTVAA